jgi:hypothetical protein
MNLEVGKVYHYDGNTLLLAHIDTKEAILVPVARTTGEIIPPEEAMNFCLNGPVQNLTGLMAEFQEDTREEVLEAAKIYMTPEYQERFRQ